MKYLKKASDWVDRISMVLAITLYSTFVILMLLQIFQRNFIPQHAWTVTDSLCRYCFIWASLLGVSCVSKHRSHISITFLPDMLKGNLRKAWAFIARLMFIALLVFLVYWGVYAVNFNANQRLDSVFFRASVTYAAIPVGCATAAFQELCNFIEHIVTGKEVKAK